LIKVRARLDLPSFVKQRIPLWADGQRLCFLAQPLGLLGQAFAKGVRLLDMASLHPHNSMSIEGQTNPKDERNYDYQRQPADGALDHFRALNRNLTGRGVPSPQPLVQEPTLGTQDYFRNSETDRYRLLLRSTRDRLSDSRAVVSAFARKRPKIIFACMRI
jgi:hypothetical protein